MKRLVFALCILAAGFSSAVAQSLDNFKNEKWVKVSGNLGANCNLYAVNGIAPRRVPFQWTGYGNVTVTIKGLSLPFSFQYSNQQREFRQPFNVFGLTPTYKWMKLYLGWRNMQWSNYTLNNHLFLGAGIEINPHKIRFGAMYGRFLKAVNEDSAKQVYNRISQYPVAAYNRFGYGLKIGYGNEKGFVDIIFFHAKDDISSVTNQPYKQLTAPGENASLGYKTKFKFLRHFTFESDAAVSILTRDLRADTLEFDKKYSGIARLVLIPHLSTQIYYATDASLTYQKERLTAALKFQRIMPDYRSYGAYYTQTDVQRITIAPQYYTKKGKLFLNASMGLEKDNLAKKKLAQTNRTIGSFTLTYRPITNAGITASLSNYGTSQKPGTKSISDTVILNQVTNSLILSPYYLIMGKVFTHSIMYNFTNQTLTDKNKINSQNFSMTMINNSLSYGIANGQTGFKADFTAFIVKSHLSVGDGKNVGGSVGMGKGFVKNTLNSYVTVTYSSNSFNGNSDGNTLQMRWNNNYRITKKNVLSLIATYTNNTTKSGAISKTFQEYLATISFNHQF
jgi:hypothetical protein